MSSRQRKKFGLKNKEGQVTLTVKVKIAVFVTYCYLQHIHAQTEKSGRSLTENCSKFTEHKSKICIIFVGTDLLNICIWQLMFL